MGVIMIGAAEKAEVWDPCQPDEPAGFQSSGCVVDDEVSLQLGLGLLMLLESSAYARMLDEDPWEFSIEWPELQRIGLTRTEGRWLIHGGLVEHAHEVTSVEDQRRRFVAAPNLSLSTRSCLILTEEGRTLARRVADTTDDDLTNVAGVPAAIHLVRGRRSECRRGDGAPIAGVGFRPATIPSGFAHREGIQSAGDESGNRSDRV